MISSSAEDGIPLEGGYLIPPSARFIVLIPCLTLPLLPPTNPSAHPPPLTMSTPTTLSPISPTLNLSPLTFPPSPTLSPRPASPTFEPAPLYPTIPTLDGQKDMSQITHLARARLTLNKVLPELKRYLDHHQTEDRLVFTNYLLHHL